MPRRGRADWHLSVEHDEIRNHVRVAKVPQGCRGRFLDKGLLTNDAAGSWRSVLGNTLAFQGRQYRRERPRIADHAERHNGMPLHCPVLHGFDQAIHRARIADHAQRNGSVLPDGAIRVLQHVKHFSTTLGCFHPGPTDLIVGGHAAQSADRMAANDKILIGQRVEQWMDRRLADCDSAVPAVSRTVFDESLNNLTSAGTAFSARIFPRASAAALFTAPSRSRHAAIKDRPLEGL